MVSVNVDKNIEMAKLKQQLGFKNKMLYGSKSEQSEIMQLEFFNEIEDINDNDPAVEIAEEEVVKTKIRKRKTTKSDNYAKLPHEHVYHNLNVNDADLA